MLCGELLNGGFVSAGALPALPSGLLGLWLPGCLRATSPRLRTSPYLPLLAELLATGQLDLQDCLMDLAKRNLTNSAADLDLDLRVDDNDENVLLENGLRSFENPNYHLDPARLDDALNSNGNGSTIYDEHYQQLAGNGGRSGEVTGGGGEGGGGGGTRVQARRTYASLDLGSMGVDVTQGPLTVDSVTEDAPDNTDNHNLGYCEKADNETTDMGGVPHVEGGLNSELYAIPVKRRQPKDQKNDSTQQNNVQKKVPADVDTTESEDKDEVMPRGWVKFQDPTGPYCWNMINKRVQRISPNKFQYDIIPQYYDTKTENRNSLVKDNDSINNFPDLGGTVNANSALDQQSENKKKLELALQYSSEGVTESALVDDTLNGNPRPSSPSSSPPSTSTSSSILPARSSLLQQTGSTVDAAEISATRNYCEKADNETTDMGSVPHVEGGLNSELYAVPVKRRQPKDQKNESTQQNDVQKKVSGDVDSTESEDKDDQMPPGWKKFQDPAGPYYWHVTSGRIQRELPKEPRYDIIAQYRDTKTEYRKSLVKDNDSINNFPILGGTVNTVTRSNTSSALDQEAENKKKLEVALKRRSYPARADSEGRDKPIRFAVRSLGWTEIAEEDLTPERSSKAVNKCIVDLSLGKNDLLDVVGRWGDGKDLFMDLDEGALKLIDPENLTVLNTQPIHTVRVWGVGRDHCRERDFAYVARDRSTRKHMCHVFRCDIPARTIANTLRDICKKIMIERSQHQNLAKPVDINGRTSLATRPTNLPTEHRRFHRNGQALDTQSFPTPMEEPKKVLKAQYLGSMQVTQATGMEVLNDAIDHIVSNTPLNQWQNVNVAVAPSMISILTPNDDKLITECRVRYLSFLGIGRNVKQCAFIMHTAQDLFIAHVFNCEPSSGALCKTIEAACKLRYQKCLDAHPQGFRNASSLNTPNGRGLGATLKSLVGSLTGRRNKQGES